MRPTGVATYASQSKQGARTNRESGKRILNKRHKHVFNQRQQVTANINNFDNENQGQQQAQETEAGRHVAESLLILTHALNLVPLWFVQFRFRFMFCMNKI